MSYFSINEPAEYKLAQTENEVKKHFVENEFFLSPTWSVLKKENFMSQSLN